MKRFLSCVTFALAHQDVMTGQGAHNKRPGKKEGVQFVPTAGYYVLPQVVPSLPVGGAAPPPYTAYANRAWNAPAEFATYGAGNYGSIGTLEHELIYGSPHHVTIGDVTQTDHGTGVVTFTPPIPGMINHGTGAQLMHHRKERLPPPFFPPPPAPFMPPMPAWGGFPVYDDPKRVVVPGRWDPVEESFTIPITIPMNSNPNAASNLTSNTIVSVVPTLANTPHTDLDSTSGASTSDTVDTDNPVTAVRSTNNIPLPEVITGAPALTVPITGAPPTFTPPLAMPPVFVTAPQPNLVLAPNALTLPGTNVINARLNDIQEGTDKDQYYILSPVPKPAPAP